MDTTGTTGPRPADPAGPAGPAGGAATTPLPALGPGPGAARGDDPAGTRTGTDVPPGGPAPGAAPPRASGFFASLRRVGVARSEERWVGGVAGGLAERFDVDALLVRGLLAVSVLLGGLGLVAYGLAWLLLPERRDGRIHLEELVRGRFDMAVVGGILLVLVGLSRGDRWWIRGGDADVLVGLGWVAFLGLVAWVVVAAARRREGRVPPAPGPYGPFAAPATEGVPGGAPAGGTTWAATAPASAGTTGATGTAGTVPPPPSPPTGDPVTTSTVPFTPPTGQPAGPVPPAPSWADGGAGTPGAGGPGTPGGWSWSTGGAGAPVPPPRPPRPRRRGPGTGAVGAVVAVMLLTLATLLLLERADRFDGPVLLTAAGAGLVVTGLAILLAGLRGRTSGALGFLAVLTALVAVPLGLAHGTVDGPWERRGGPTFGDLDVTWTQRQQATAGIEQGLGDVRVDLTALPLAGSTLVVPVDVGAGNVELVVPEGAEVSGDLEVGLGNIDWYVGGVQESRDGAGNSLDVRTSGVADGGSADLHLVVHVGMGNVSVVEG